MNELSQEVEALRSEILALAETPELTEAQEARYVEANARFDAATAELRAAEARAEQVAKVRSFVVPQGTAPTVERSNGPAVIVKRSAEEVLEDRSTTGRERTRQLADALLRSNESKIENGSDQAHFERIARRHGGDHRWAEGILARSTDVYADAFAKVVTGREMLLDNEERAAVAIGTTTQGGLLVPTHLDPSLIVTNDGSSNVMRAAGTTKVTLTEGNVWYGVTTAGVTASWDAELTEVSDDSPTVASASITCFQAQALVQATVQAFDDISGLQSNVLALFADAKDQLEGAAHMTGNGTSAPGGLFTLINASSSLKTTSTTAATIGEVDIHALYRALPVRWRSRGTFVGHPLFLLATKRLGTAVSSSYTGDLTTGITDRILGRPVLESDDAPSTTTTTALDQEIAFADLSSYVIVDKPGGVSIEFIPHLFNTSNNLPDGRRAWYMRWRTGAGMPALAAGRLLVDKTSA